MLFGGKAEGLACEVRVNCRKMVSEWGRRHCCPRVTVLAERLCARYIKNLACTLAIGLGWARLQAATARVSRYAAVGGGLRASEQRNAVVCLLVVREQGLVVQVTNLGGKSESLSRVKMAQCSSQSARMQASPSRRLICASLTAYMSNPRGEGWTRPIRCPLAAPWGTGEAGYLGGVPVGPPRLSWAHRSAEKSQTA